MNLKLFISINRFQNTLNKNSLKLLTILLTHRILWFLYKVCILKILNLFISIYRFKKHWFDRCIDISWKYLKYFYFNLNTFTLIIIVLKSLIRFWFLFCSVYELGRRKLMKRGVGGGVVWKVKLSVLLAGQTIAEHT